MHIESRGRVEVGQYVRAGERIGHPSCEGGFSTGTHLHLARRYNGEWIAADGDLPFVMDKWVSYGVGIEYDGYLTRNARTVTAWNGRSPENQISR
jgi:murein DD-endopeptidase MepM/ murein hydrolase activator NlpD